MKRLPISKAVRFQIFTRDGFTCRYCGRQSDHVKLEVDHIEPVCQGGTNAIENLITACQDCNRGKSGKTIAQHAPTETDRLRISQEHQEQLEALAAAKASAEARADFRQEICNYICGLTGKDSCNRITLNIMCKFADTYGCEMLFEWLDIASAQCRRPNDERQIGMYVCGIRRKFDLAMSDPALDEPEEKMATPEQVAEIVRDFDRLAKEKSFNPTDEELEEMDRN